MKKYVVKNRETQEIFGKFDSKSEASEELMNFIEEHNEYLDSDDEDYLTPFDFTLDEVEISEPNETITCFEEARKYLGGKPNNDFTVSKKLASNNAVRLDDVTLLVQSLNPNHVKALIALNKLFTLAQAWNKADGFVPDFGNRDQFKYFPWFRYDNETAGFAYAYASSPAATASAAIGSRLCFKNEKRARQFGEQFADLYNEVFLIM